jgi:Amt family ammonium transporter
MRPLQKKLVAFSLPLCTAILAINVLGQTTTSTAVTDDRVLKLETALTNAQMAGDNAWMLTCSALVLMMTGPGLALFYGGLVRKKNVLATMMQSFILMALVTVLWIQRSVF